MTARRISLDESVRPAVASDLAEMARVHVTSGTPGLLSDLGEGFLRDVYYRGLLESRDGEALVLELSGRVVGLVTWSPNSERLFGAIFRARFLSAGIRVLARGLRHPRVFRDFAQSVFAVKGASAGASIPAEVVSLEIAPAFQGLGLGYVLLERAVGSLRAEGQQRVKARILADHSAVERLYLRLGFTAAEPFRLHGREWVLMVLSDEG